MSNSVGRFIIDSKIKSRICEDITVGAAHGSALRFMTLETGDGAHSIFVIVKDNIADFSYQFSVAVPYGTTYNDWVEALPLGATFQSDKIALDLKTDGLMLALRVRKTGGFNEINPTVVTYNLGYDTTAEVISVSETDAEVIGSIPSISDPGVTVNTSTNDHNSLLNKGSYTHAEIDDFIDNFVSPPIDRVVGIELTGQTPIGNKLTLQGATTEFIAGTTVVVVNGYRQTRGVQYIEHPDTAEIEFLPGALPEITDNIVVDFSKYRVNIFAASVIFKYNHNISSQTPGSSYNVNSIATEFIPETLIVFVNGVRQTRGEQYYEEPEMGTFEFYPEAAPEATDHIVVDFQCYAGQEV